jgi:hypothetical protein
VPLVQIFEVHWKLSVHAAPFGRGPSQTPLAQLPEAHW